MEIKFITSNSGKAKTLQSYFNQLGRDDVIITPINLDIVEPQASSVDEVSLSKAKKAYEILKAPVLVEDGGFSIGTLKGFPGVYTKYILQTIGPEGILKLMNGVEDRFAKFISTATFIDESGNVQQFHRKGGEVSIAKNVSSVKSPWAWSDLWKIIYIESVGKTMSEMSEEEVNQYYSKGKAEGSLNIFANWFVENK